MKAISAGSCDWALEAEFVTWKAMMPGQSPRNRARVGDRAMGLGSIRNLDYVVLLCDQIAKTRAFYRDVMKFPLETDQENWVSFRVGSGLLTLRARGPAGTWSHGPNVPGSASVQLAFRVPPPDVDDCHKELIAHGIEIMSPPADLPAWRHRTLFFRDPEGNVIEIYAEL